MKASRAFIAIAVAALAAMAAPAAAGTPAERTLAAVDQSGYSPEERMMLRQEASRALQAGVPAEDLELIVLRSRERGTSAATVREFMGTAAHALEQQLPVRPVLDRIEQGLAKGVPPERTAAASQQLVANLAAARPLVDGLAKRGLTTGSSREREEAIESVARARERAVPDSVLLKTGERAGEHGRSLASFDRAVRSLTFFVGSGMPVNEAGRVIGDSLERGFTEKDYVRLERSVNETLHRGGTMDDAVHAAEREIRESRGSGDGRVGGAQERGSSSGRDPGGRGGRGR